MPMGRMAVVNLASDDSVGRECTFPEFPCLIRNSDLVLQFCCNHSAGRISHTTQALLPWRQAEQNSCLGDAFINILNAKGGLGLHWKIGRVNYLHIDLKVRTL